MREGAEENREWKQTSQIHRAIVYRKPRCWRAPRGTAKAVRSADMKSVAGKGRPQRVTSPARQGIRLLRSRMHSTLNIFGYWLASSSWGMRGAGELGRDTGEECGQESCSHDP